MRALQLCLPGKPPTGAIHQKGKTGGIKMKEMVRYGFILALICTIASGLLAGMNLLTKARINAQAQDEEEASLKEVLPQGERFEAVRAEEEVLYYKVYDKSGKFVAVAFKASGKGYSSVIESMVGMNKDGVINAIKILSQNETPGLGAKVVEPGFVLGFSNKNLSQLDNIQAITGATISSGAVIDSVKKRAEEIKGII
ncbi:MAG: RnfABCDGE type electron transport complex subunit G [Candidatus Omnitrophica bacterium]|nr:RnfABCDGE type electron transport complex subunit G [Candidatus Omnitrophota bacterium]